MPPAFETLFFANGKSTDNHPSLLNYAQHSFYGPAANSSGDRLIKNYCESLHQFGQLEFDHEGAVRSAFQALLDGYGKRLEWKLVPEYPYKKVRVDGALLDTWKQRRGFWEAKDVNDDLEKELRRNVSLVPNLK